MILLAAIGCGGPKQLIVKEESRDSGPPTWISQAVTHPEYLYFVGLTDRARSLKEGRDQARQDAANQASSYIGIRISTDTFIQDSTAQSSTFVNEQTRSSTDASISFLEVTDEYYVKTSRTAGNFYEETYAVYVLCRFPRTPPKKKRSGSRKLHKEMAPLPWHCTRMLLRNWTGTSPWRLLKKSAGSRPFYPAFPTMWR